MLRDQESVPNLNISVLENPIVSSSGSRTVFDRGRSPRWLGNGEIILLTVSSQRAYIVLHCKSLLSKLSGIEIVSDY